MMPVVSGNKLPKAHKLLISQQVCSFLGGLSLHFNHLIASRMTNYDGHLGHFILDFLGQIWTQETLRHILGPILVIF